MTIVRASQTEVPARPLFLTVMIVLVAVGIAKAVWTIVFDPTGFWSSFPGMTPSIFVAYMATLGGMGLMLIGLWLMKRWSGALVILVSATAIVLDVIAEAPTVHVGASVVSTILMLAAIYPVRGWFFRNRTKVDPVS